MRKLVLSIIRSVLKHWYNFEVFGENHLNLEKEKRPVMYVANHISWLDALFMMVILPSDIPFVVYSGTLKKWWAKLLLSLGPKPISIDNNSAYSVRDMVKILNDVNGPRRLVIYPEGRLSTTGGMMKVQPGAGMVALKSDVVIVPMWLDGVEHLKLNRLKGKVKQSVRPTIRIVVGSPYSLNKENLEGLTPKEQRKIVTNQIENNILNVGINKDLPHLPDLNLTQTFFDSMKKNGNKNIMEDVNGNVFSYKKLALSSIIIGKQITKGNKKNPIGILLPNSNITVSTLLGVSFWGHIFHPINFSMGESGIVSICHTLNIKRVVTSSAFLEKAKLSSLSEVLKQNGIEVIFLETIKNKINIFHKILGYINFYNYKKLPGFSVDPNSMMTILSTSGSEGSPKGVCLSHSNMITNVQQVIRVIDVSSQDRFLNAMPIFHSFGLMGGVLLPIVKGAWSYQYPSPLHGRVIPALSYDKNITIAFATDTFLNIWAKNADSYSFYKIRAIVAGAERVKPETKRIYAEKFGVRILEGYGATETSPVISLNTFIHSKMGSVGKILPGMKTKLEDVPGVEGKKLLVSGPNVMMGYILASEPGKLIPAGEWYDTGDIVTIDNDGYITIQGRAKRFAKIAGEMVSLNYVESFFEDTEGSNVIIAVPDDKKGEKLIFITDNKNVTLEDIKNKIKKEKASELIVPKTMFYMEKIPLLGTGKINYPEIIKAFLSQ